MDSIFTMYAFPLFTDTASPFLLLLLSGRLTVSVWFCYLVCPIPYNFPAIWNNILLKHGTLTFYFDGEVDDDDDDDDDDGDNDD